MSTFNNPKSSRVFAASLALWLFAFTVISTASVKAQSVNLIANPSAEQSDTSGQPSGWYKHQTGTSTSSFTYANDGHTGNRSLLVSVSNYSSGDSKWFFEHVPVSPGSTYQFTDYYKSSATTAVLAEYQMASGGYTYKWFGDVGPSTLWAQARFTFAVPAGVSKMTILHLINTNGTLQTDDYSLSAYTPQTFSHPLVSITFDDGYNSVYNQALPITRPLGENSTLYIITNDIGKSGYMTKSMLSTMKTQGNEIASHTVTHPYLTTVTSKKLQTELLNSRDVLASYFTGPINNFASPYGDYNDAVINAIKPLYRSHRTIDAGFNSKDSFDQYRIKSYMIEYTTPVATVESLIDQAKQSNTWLVLTYHEVDKNSTWTYNRKPSDFKTEMTYLKSSGVAVKTIDAALNDLLPQLN